MPGTNFSNIVTMTAGGTVNVDNLVKLSAAKTVAECTADTDVAIGVARSSATVGETIAVQLHNTPVLIECSEAITFANYIAPHTDSRAKTWAAGDTKVAYALNTTTGAGEFVWALLCEPEAPGESSTFVNLVSSGNTTLGDAASDIITLNGYVVSLRVGTGSTPTVTPGADDVFIEGTCEVDGVLYADGGMEGDVTGSITGGAASAMTGADDSLVKGMDAKHVTIADAGDVAFWVADEHPKAIVLEAWAMLTEVPDSSADTIIVRLDDGTNNITDALTFTEGTDAVGAVKKFTVDTDYDNIAIADKIDIAVSGASTTLGEVTVFMRFAGEA